jgi:transcriptional regulator with XRE-family HTH domain
MLRMSNLATIGSFLRQARKDRAMTVSELATQAGISRNTLGALEAGRGNVELNTLLALLRCLELELQFVPQSVTDLARFGTDTKPTGLQDEVRGLMQSPARRRQS